MNKVNMLLATGISVVLLAIFGQQFSLADKFLFFISCFLITMIVLIMIKITYTILGVGIGLLLIGGLLFAYGFIPIGNTCIANENFKCTSISASNSSIRITLQNIANDVSVNDITFLGNGKCTDFTSYCKDCEGALVKKYQNITVIGKCALTENIYGRISIGNVSTVLVRYKVK